MAEFDTGLPSIRKIQAFIKDKQPIEVKLMSNDLLVGRLLWQDAQAICLIDESEQQILIWRQSLAYLKPSN